MSRLMAAVLVSLIAISLLSSLASAQYPADGEAIPPGEAFPASLIMGALFIVLIVAAVIIAILAFVFWILMLVDCVQRDFEDKVVWVLIIVLLGLLGGILYYFIVKRKDKRHAKGGKKKG